jgi:ubiquinone/menaquinone biosynthesis C-methylase UbiE
MTDSVADVAHRFDDGLPTTASWGRWSRAAGAILLDWLAAPPGACWLDVGCGTGSLTEMIVDTRSPAAVFAIDPVPTQIDQACRQPVAQWANSRLATHRICPSPI